MISFSVGSPPKDDGKIVFRDDSTTTMPQLMDRFTDGRKPFYNFNYNQNTILFNTP